MASQLFAGFLFDDAGAPVVGATVNLYDAGTTTPVRATTTTSATGAWAISHATEGTFDVEIVNGSSIRRRKYTDRWQLDTIEVANLNIRNPADTFDYSILPAAIAADRTLTLPLITGTDTLAVLGLAQTWTGVQTFGAVTLGGVVSGGGQQVNNVIIGTVTPLAGKFTTLEGTDATDSSSSTTGALKIAGGLGLVKSLFSTGNIVTTAAAARLEVQNPTNSGVHSMGGNAASPSILDNQTFTVTMDNAAAVICIQDSDGKAAVFVCTYASSTVTALADPSSMWNLTDVDTAGKWAIFKGAASHTFTIKNYTNATKTLRLNIVGLVTSATAPA